MTSSLFCATASVCRYRQTVQTICRVFQALRPCIVQPVAVGTRCFQTCAVRTFHARSAFDGDRGTRGAACRFSRPAACGILSFFTCLTFKRRIKTLIVGACDSAFLSALVESHIRLVAFGFGARFRIAFDASAVGDHISITPFAGLAFFVPKAARRTSFRRRAGCDRSVRPALGAADAFANRAVIGTAGAYAADDGDVGTGAAVARSVFVSACHALFDDAGARFKDVAVIAGNFRTSPSRRASGASAVGDGKA